MYFYLLSSRFITHLQCLPLFDDYAVQRAGTVHSCHFSLLLLIPKAGMSNIRLTGQNQPVKVSDLAHWVTLKNVKKGIHLGVLTVICKFYNFS